jgi:hypothetical protein
MRGAGVTLIMLMAGCRFDLPARGPGDAASDGPADDGPGDGPVDVPSGLARRKQITIDPARVTGNQTAFPVWIALTDSDLQARAAASGADIHFTGPDGTPPGRLEAWVRANLDDNAPTVLEVRYGDPAAAHPANPPAVFSSAFLAVWHLDDALGAAAVAEATGQRTGTAQGGLGPTDQVPARLGGGLDLDGNDDRIEFVNPFAGSGDHTFSAWVNQRTASGFDGIIVVGNPATNQSRIFHSHYTVATPAGVFAGVYGNDWPTSPNPLPNIQGAGWVLLHWTYQGGAGRLGRVYRDGVLVDMHSFSGGGGGPNTQGTQGFLGYSLPQLGPGGNTPCALNGTLDEVRLASVARSPDWIATEFANQSSPQTFYAVGPELTVP